ncbi:MAG: hypothetical protein H7A23_06730 [Leptospiraceae bacterium]|nr:hypothetical protein [Leptospiraceae bacterium]
MDKLGEYSQFFHDISINNKMKNNININTQNHIINLSSELGNQNYNLNFSIKSLNGDSNYKDGILIEEVSSESIIKISDQILNHLEFGSLKTFSRIGFRCLILVEEEKFNYEGIKNILLNQNKTMSDIIQNTFSKPNDIAIVFEALDDNTFLNIQFGPYREREREKYFYYQPKAKEALILDIDLFQRDIEIPQFKLLNFIKYQSIKMKDITMGIRNGLKESL